MVCFFREPAAIETFEYDYSDCNASENVGCYSFSVSGH
jgi:hypothetical protein